MQHIAEMVGDNLHFNMGGALQVALVEQAGVGESGGGGFARPLNDGFQFRHIVHDVDADAAAAGGGLDHHGKAQLPGFGDGFVIPHRLLGAGHYGQAGLASYSARRKFVRHLAEHFFAGADKDDALGFAAPGKFAVFRQESVTGMDGGGGGSAAGGQHGINVEVGIGGGGRPDANRFIGLPGVGGAGVGLRIDGYSGDAQPLAGANDAGGDFAPVSDQYFAEHLAPFGIVAPPAAGCCETRPS